MTPLLEALLDPHLFTPFVGESQVIATSLDMSAKHWHYCPELYISEKQNDITFTYVAADGPLPSEAARWEWKHLREDGTVITPTHCCIILHFRLTPESDFAMRNGHRSMLDIMRESEMIVGVGMMNIDSGEEYMAKYTGRIMSIPDPYKPTPHAYMQLGDFELFSTPSQNSF